MPESEDRGIAVKRGVAANDNPGSGARPGHDPGSRASGGAKARIDAAVMTLARTIGRRIASKELDRLDAAGDNAAAKDAGEELETRIHDPEHRALCALFVRPAAGGLD